MATANLLVVPDKTIFRSNLLPKDKAKNEDNKRFERHKKWLQEKAHHSKLTEDAKRSAERIARELEEKAMQESKEKEYEKEVKLLEWLKKKELDDLKRRSIELSKSVKKDNKKDQKFSYDNWLQSKEEKKKLEKMSKNTEVKTEIYQKEVKKAMSEICFEKWKNDVKKHNMKIPKNGYEIFGPKPKRVVAQDWVYPTASDTESEPAFGNVFLLKSDRSLCSSMSLAEKSDSKMCLPPWTRSNIMPKQSSASLSRTSVAYIPNVRKFQPKKKPPFR